MGTFSLNNRTMIAFLALLALTILFALSRMPGGIGGTGITGAPGGIGGTGIYGRIDAFGSIWVNGVEIFYDEDQNVVRQGRDGQPDRLAVGQIVAVVIDESTGRAEAQSIEIVEEVVGPVTEATNEQINILGQVVLLTEDTVIDLPNNSFLGVENLAIGGLRTNGGEIVATHISVPLVNDAVALRGRIERVGQDNYWIEDQWVTHENHGFKEGDHLEVEGKLETSDENTSNVRVKSVKARGSIPFDTLPAKIMYPTLSNQNDYYSDRVINGRLISVPTHAAPDNPALTNIGNLVVYQANSEITDGRTRVVTSIDDVVLSRDIGAQRASEVIRERRREAIESARDNVVVIQADPESSAVLVQEIMDSLQEEDLSDQPLASETEAGAQEVRRPAIVRSQQSETPAPPRPQRIVDPVRQPLIDQRRREQIRQRRVELSRKWLQDANVRRLAAVEVRRIAIQRAREQMQEQIREQLQDNIQNDTQNFPQAVFTPQELDQMLRDGNIDRATFDRIQRDVRDGVRRDLREGTREQVREEVRRRIRAEIRRRIRLQLRNQ